MIQFPPNYPEEGLLKKAVRWSLQNRYHIPSLSELAPRRSLEELTELGRAWQAAELGSMMEVSEEGRRSVHFSLNDTAVLAVKQLNQKSLVGRIRAINRSDWIALGALVISFFALLKPGS